MSRRVATALAAAGLALCATACKADIAVGIDANADGSGTVRVEVVVDKDITDRIDLSKQLQVEDLKAAGWKVEGPTSRPGGLTAVIATKAFSDEGGAARAMDEVSGPSGPFTGFRLSHERSFAKTTTSFEGKVDFTRGLDAFGDPEVGAALGTNDDLGIDRKALEKQIGGPLANAVTIKVSARLPGTVSSNAPSQAGNGAVWTPKLTERVELTASGESWNTTNLVGAGAAGVVVFGGLVTGAVVVVRRRRR